MLPGILHLLETQLGMDNPFVAFLLSITSGKSDGFLQIASGLIALAIWTLFVLSITYYRHSMYVTNDKKKVKKMHDFLGEEGPSIGLKMLIGTTVIFLFFGTSMLFDSFLLPILVFFSDNESINVGLKFLFRYDTEGLFYKWYYAFVLLVLTYTFVRTVYFGVFYHIIYKGEGIRFGPGGETFETNFRQGFKIHGILFCVIVLVCFSTAPEWALNIVISPFSDRTVHDILLGIPGKG